MYKCKHKCKYRRINETKTYKKRQLRKEVALSGLFDKNYQFFSATGVTETELLSFLPRLNVTTPSTNA